MLKEFKEFAAQGNVIDLAIGVIIGGAFGAIVSSFVADIIMPPIGLLLGGVDFSNLSIILKQATESAGAVTLNYGIFINTIIDFIIVAFVIFMVIRYMNRLKKQKQDAPVSSVKSDDILLLEEIRDLLKNK